MTITELKAIMLCEGIDADPVAEELFRRQNPSNVKRGGLSSGAKMELVRESWKGAHGWFPELRLSVNAPLYRVREADVKVVATEPDTRDLTVYHKGKFVMRAKALPAPTWYGQKVDCFDITQILTKHGTQLAGAVYEDCALFGINEACRFCVINRSLKDKTPKLVLKSGDLFINALNKIPAEDYAGLSLNGGMTTHLGRGMELISPVVNRINRAYPKLPIAVEITPPEDLTWIGRLADAGVSSIMMNMECWDPEIRAQLIPGKSKYCTREMYLKAFRYALKILGPGRVTTCFIVGTEPVASLKSGITEVIDMGVIPSPLAGRYFEDVPDYPFVPNTYWREFLEIIRFTKDALGRGHISSTDKAGCVACGMCDMIGNL